MSTLNLEQQVIDNQGYRANVGIILINNDRRVFWGKRMHQNAWQFPQGGVDPNESVQDTMYRELHEEVGLQPHDVEVLACTSQWLRYKLPRRFIRYGTQPLCIGQKQRWFLLKLKTDESAFNLEACDKPEFEAWRWVYYWYPVKKVIAFKRQVYRQALKAFSPFVFPEREAQKEAYHSFSEGEL